MELKFEGLKMQKLNTQMDRAQRVNEKNGDICLVIMFTPQVMVIKMSNSSFFVFSADTNKKSVTFLTICLHASDRSYRGSIFSSPRECCELLDSELPLATYRPWKIQKVIIFG